MAAWYSWFRPAATPALLPPVTCALVSDRALLATALRQEVVVPPEFRWVGTWSWDELATKPDGPSPCVLVADLADASGDSTHGSDRWPRLFSILNPATRVLALLADADLVAGTQALAAGAKGCISERETAAEWQAALRRVAAGRWHLSRGWCQRWDRTGPGTLVTQLARLTARERTLFDALGSAEPWEDVFAGWGLSPQMVATYVERVQRKLHVRSSSELVLLAQLARLLLVDDRRTQDGDPGGPASR
ncbi:MAG: hypothetical protein U0935_02150 [Pirellulales bacterium]